MNEVNSRTNRPKWPHLPGIGQDFLIDSPCPRPPASDWPAADSQATPTLALQCDHPPLALQRRRRAPNPTSHSNASHGAAYPYMYPTRRGLWGINDLSLVRGAPGAAPLARPTATRRSLAQRGLGFIFR